MMNEFVSVPGSWWAVVEYVAVVFFLVWVVVQVMSSPRGYVYRRMRAEARKIPPTIRF